MTKIVFNEDQRFNQPWLWILVILTTLGSLTMVFIEFNQAETQENRGGLLIAAFLVITGMGLIITLLFSIKLETRIDEQGIHYKFRPFVWHWKLISSSEITSVEVIKYNPILHYGGWGYRIGIKGRALNIRGNVGISIIFKKGKKLLIGTQKPEEANRAIKQLFNQESQ